MQKVLDEILFSENVVEAFYKNYKNAEFKNWLNQILPEVEVASKTEQDNPWHVYNVLDHILHSVEEINKQTKNLDFKTRKMLAYTMFFHDMGKPECKIRRYSGLYKREVDSFFDHNKKSAVIAKRALKNLDFSQEEQKAITALVLDHDIFMFITLTDDKNPYHRVLKKSVIEEEIINLNKAGNGQTLMKYLIMVGVADNMAQNKIHIQEPLYKLTVMNNMLDRIIEGKSLND